MEKPVQTLGNRGTGRQRGLVPEIVQALSQDIRTGAIEQGQKLPSEAELMGRFSVSRTVVREAISRLQASGLVQTRHGIGTFAQAGSEPATFRIAPEDFSTVADVIALLELRISLETEAAGLAAMRRTAQDLERMEAALHTFDHAVLASSDAVPADFQFHLDVARATGNRHFEDLMTYLGTMIIPRTRINTANAAPEGRSAYLQRVHMEHENIYQAIRAGDADAARAAMRTHLSNSRERLRRSQPRQTQASE